MKAVVIGTTKLRDCPRCEGLWADTASIEQICADREKQAAILGMPHTISPVESGAIEDKVRYLPCPVCRQLMNRINFAHFSNVIVDVCKAHGTWFDRDELRRIIEFIRSGGMDTARARELAEIESQRRQLNAAKLGQVWDSSMRGEVFASNDYESGFSIVASLLKSLIR
jgi:Zn-finger nucleic acid-binding protein